MLKNEKIEQYKKMANSGDIYDSVDNDWLEYQHSLVQKINDFNNTPESDTGLKMREKILKSVVGTYGENLFIIPPVYANSGLSNVHFGKEVFINLNCNFVDDGSIYIDDYTMVGPGVTFATAVHPTSPKLRKSKLQYNKPIHVGKNVWIGANATILPGVTIGDNSIIGGGSIVTKDVAENIIAVGNPAKQLRDITENDDIYYDKNKKIPQNIIDEYM